MHKFVKIVLVIAIAAGPLVVSAQAYAFSHPWTQLAQITLDPPDRQPGTTSGARPVTKKPESRPASLPVPSVALDPPVNQTDELGLASDLTITGIDRPERGTVPRSQPLSVEQSTPAPPSPPAVSPAPASPAASIQPTPAPAKPTPVAPAPVAEPRDQDKKDNRGRGEDNNGQGKWHGRGYGDGGDRDGPDGSYRIERADKVDRSDKVDRPEKIERAEKVERVERVEKVDTIEKIEKIDKSGRPDRVERLQKVEKPERGKK
jgi:hypothetical protein